MPHLIEADEPAIAMLSQSGQPTGELETAPALAPRSAAVPIMRTRTPRKSASAGKMMLAVIGLVLFAALGILLGLMIRTQDLHLPDWIQRMARP
jgi:hypothetical protein